MSVHLEAQEHLLEKSKSSESTYKSTETVQRSRLQVLIQYGAGFLLGTLFFVFALSSLSSTVTSTPSSLPDWSKNPEIAQCGSSPSEAESLGCTFDALAASYLPRHCYSATLFSAAQEEATDNLLSNELFHPLRPYPTPATFEWYTDHNLTLPIPQDDIPSLLPFEAFTWERYHVAHCTYMWRQVLDATSRVQQGEKDVFVNSRALDQAHMAHCRYVMAEQVRRVGATARVYFGYGNCTRLS